MTAVRLVIRPIGCLGRYRNGYEKSWGHLADALIEDVASEQLVTLDRHVAT